MTGQEWYDNFNEELKMLVRNLPATYEWAVEHGYNKEGIMAIIGHSLDKAARRAARIDYDD